MINFSWIEKKMSSAPAWEKATVFILAPQIFALVVTGFSLTHMWRDRNRKNRDWFYLKRNIVIWVLALAWFYTWWLALFPIFVYTTATYFI